MDKVLIRDLVVSAIIGIHEHERHAPQPILVNLEIFTDLRRPGETDRIADCVDYQRVADAVIRHAGEARRLTVEALAADAARIVLAVPGVERVIVRVEKPEALPYCRTVGVEIDRRRADGPA